MLRASLLLALVASACSVNRPAAAPPPPPVPTVRVDVWHDTVCPWCRIGLHNLETVAAGLSSVKVEVVHHAFLLEPDAPAQGADLRARLGAKYGAERLDEMFGRVTQVGASYGVRFNWDRVRVSPNSLPSHALIAWAPEKQRGAVIAGIHKAYFEEGQNLGDAEVLASIAAAAGLDASAARIAVLDSARLAVERASAEEASSRGITGVPYFVMGGLSFSGALGPEKLRAAILVAAAQGTSAKQ